MALELVDSTPTTKRMSANIARLSNDGGGVVVDIGSSGDNQLDESPPAETAWWINVKLTIVESSV